MKDLAARKTIMPQRNQCMLKNKEAAVILRIVVTDLKAHQDVYIYQYQFLD